ncbi:DNA polymerase iota [Culicoides brevitarsis]|uniref:DNA polymerase iota n=1 Tax=Culicoides brevitarsis TaxID=469753 RepID=UPI00307C4748
MHEKVIVHIDIDCFYAQVEEILEPSLREKPLGIQQKTCLVTCNYKAREFGCKKLMFIPEAQKLCPELVLVNGEDLTKYKKMSDQIFNCLQKFSCNVEKLGLDENFVDVTEIVNNRMKNEEKIELSEGTFKLSFDEESQDDSECECGCHKRLYLGSVIAQELRKALFDDLGITSCAGIAHNKLLAKLVGSQNKPNKQTIIFPHQATEFLRSLGPVRSLCGIGSKTAEILEGLGVKTVENLQNIEISVLKKKFDDKTSEKLKELALGKDKSEVKPTGKQKTISIEDSTYSNPLKNLAEFETKLNVLLTRLVDAAIIEQKRTPTAFRLTIRKTMNVKELLQRESKQRDVPQSWFKSSDPTVIVPLLYPVAMQLFKQIMNEEKEFKITLVGVAFSKFLDQMQSEDANALLKFLKPKTEDEKLSPKVEKSPPLKEISKEKSVIKKFFKPIENDEQKISEEILPKKTSEPSSLMNFFKTAENNSKTPPKTVDKKRKSDTNPEKSPSPKKLKAENPSETEESTSEAVKSTNPDQKSSLDFEIPKDMDTKSFNRLPKAIKKRIINDLKNAAKLKMNPSLIDYPRKPEKIIAKSKMDAFVFKY